MADAQRSAPAPGSQPSELIDALLELLAAPRQDDFHPCYAALVQALCRAEAVAVVDTTGLQAEGLPAPARVLGVAGPAGDTAALVAQLTRERWQACQSQGYAHDAFRKPDGLGAVMLCVRLMDAVPSVLLLSLPDRDRAHLKEALVRAMLVKDLRGPAAAATGAEAMRPAAPGAADGSLLDMLGLATEVLQAPRFSAAALTLVNGAVRTLGLRQAALCWREAGEARVVAISHIDRFEKTSRLVMALQAAAAEVLATDRIIELRRVPGDDAGRTGPEGHEALLDGLDGVRHVTSLPMRDGSGQTQAVLVALGEHAPLAPDAVNQALLVLEMLYPRLADSRWRDQNWALRLRQALLARLELLVGPGRPWLKFGALVGSALLLALLFLRVPYRVEATAQLNTDSTRIITSQYDGRMLDVLVDVGDLVRKGQPLSRLDTADLRQQAAETQAEIQRFSAEEDKARAAGVLADMQVAGARRAQAQARQQRVAYLLQQAQSEAPFDGVVVEGERRNLLGASVKRGDRLFRVAEVRDLYVVLQVPEHAIRELRRDGEGELKLLSQPGQVIRFKVSNFVPMAQLKGEEGNQFLLKGQIQDPVADWWRPGMTGLAKIEAGSRNIAWILFHRMVDKLRLWLWW